MSEPDLFVICKNCSAEVSPYVTECPYCGQRVRKRAPKIEKGGAPPPRPRRVRPPSLPRLRRDEIPGIAVDTPPYATGALIAVSCVLALLVLGVRTLQVVDIGGLAPPAFGDWWRVATTPFVHTNPGYAFIALVAVGIFGTHLERRFGFAAPIAVFCVAGAAGAAVAKATGLVAFEGVLGANGAALGMLAAWLVEDRLAASRGEDRGNDLLGVYVFAAVLVLLSLAEPTASVGAAAGGVAAGAVLGLLLATFKRP